MIPLVAVQDAFPDSNPPLSSPWEDTEQVGELTWFDVLALTTLGVLTFPATSVATAEKACEPFVTEEEFHESEYGVLVSIPALLLSTKNSTLEIPEPAGSSDALAASWMDPIRVEPLVGFVRVTLGFVVSGVTAPINPVYSNRFGELVPGEMTLFGVLFCKRAVETWSGVAPLFAPRKSAATPAT
jgi:hypothetical protein